jgi:hypothetical protein
MAMSKKTYLKAAGIVREHRKSGDPNLPQAVEDAFVMLFRDDNPAFSEATFRQACGNPHPWYQKPAHARAR